MLRSLAFLFCVPACALGQGIREVLSTADMPAMPDRPDVCIAIDAEGDGDLDLVAGGIDWLWLLTNDGAGAFRHVAGEFVTANGPISALAAGDIDGDGDRDLVVGRSRYCGSTFCSDYVFRNDGRGHFTEDPSAWTGNVSFTLSLVLVDVDGDGDLDLVEANGGEPRLYDNDGQGHFTDLTGIRVSYNRVPSSIEHADVIAGDIDGDGDMDVLIAGAQGFPSGADVGHLTCLENIGGGRLLAAYARLYLQEGFISIDLGDTDGDGDLDLVAAQPRGSTITTGRVQVFRNLSGFFAPDPAALPTLAIEATEVVEFADVDADGHVDLLTGSSFGDRVYRSDGAGTFTDMSATWWPGLRTIPGARGLLAADFDADGDPDVVRLERMLELYRSDRTGRLWPAAVPLGLRSTNSNVIAGAGDVDGDGDLDFIEAGNVGLFLLRSDGIASVQRTPLTCCSYGASIISSFHLGDVDADGDLDLVQADPTTVRLLQNDGTGSFTDVSSTHMSFPWSFGVRHVQGGDLEGDGDLDIAILTWDQIRVLENDGRGRFADVSNRYGLITSTSTMGITLGDMDGDGDADILSYGHVTAPDRLFRNDGARPFADVSAQLPVLSRGSRKALFADLDGDGDLDVVRACFGALEPCRVFENDGTGRFQDATTTRLPGPTIEASGLAIADFDLDGAPDVVFGKIQGHGPRLFRNDGTGVLREDPGILGWSGHPGHLDWPLFAADADGDGDPDVLGEQILRNAHRHIETTSLVIGRRFEIRVQVQPGSTPAGAFGLPLFAPRVASTPISLPLLGDLYLDPAAATALPVLLIPRATGEAVWSVRVPHVPALVSSSVWFQALVSHGGAAPVLHLTNLARVRVGR